MSVFENIIKKHKSQLAEIQEKEEAVIAKEVSDRAKFESQFVEAVKAVAQPIFEEFQQTLNKNGYRAEIESRKDGLDNPFISIRFLPIQEGISTESDFSAFVLKANIQKMNIEHNSYYDQRPSHDGIKKQELGIESIENDTLTRNLSEFLESSLKSRS